MMHGLALSHLAVPCVAPLLAKNARSSEMSEFEFESETPHAMQQSDQAELERRVQTVARWLATRGVAHRQFIRGVVVRCPMVPEGARFVEISVVLHPEITRDWRGVQLYAETMLITDLPDYQSQDVESHLRDDDLFEYLTSVLRAPMDHLRSFEERYGDDGDSGDDYQAVGDAPDTRAPSDFSTSAYLPERDQGGGARSLASRAACLPSVAMVAVTAGMAFVGALGG